MQKFRVPELGRGESYERPDGSVSTTRVSTKERAAVVEWKLKEIIEKIQLMKFTLLR
jgi:hypothetical protein